MNFGHFEHEGLKKGSEKMIPLHGGSGSKASSMKTMNHRVDNYYMYHDVRGPSMVSAAAGTVSATSHVASLPHIPLSGNTGSGSNSNPNSVSNYQQAIFNAHHQQYQQQAMQQQHAQVPSSSASVADAGAVRTSAWTYKHGVNSVIERGEKIRPERAHVRRPVQRMNWRNTRWVSSNVGRDSNYRLNP